MSALFPLLAWIFFSPRCAFALPKEFAAAFARIREEVPGAELLKITARIKPNGRAECAKSSEPYDGWGMVLRNPDGIWMVLECLDGKPRKAYLTPSPSIGNDFVDIKTAIKGLAELGVSIPPDKTIGAALGKANRNDPPIWKIEIDGQIYQIDAQTGRPPAPVAKPGAWGQPPRKPGRRR